MSCVKVKLWKTCWQMHLMQLWSSICARQRSVHHRKLFISHLHSLNWQKYCCTTQSRYRASFEWKTFRIVHSLKFNYKQQIKRTIWKVMPLCTQCARSLSLSLSPSRTLSRTRTLGHRIRCKLARTNRANQLRSMIKFHVFRNWISGYEYIGIREYGVYRSMHVCNWCDCQVFCLNEKRVEQSGWLLPYDESVFIIQFSNVKIWLRFVFVYVWLGELFMFRKSRMRGLFSVFECFFFFFAKLHKNAVISTR